MADVSKVVANKQAVSRSVSAAISNHGNAVAEAVTDVVSTAAPQSAGLPVPEIFSTLEAVLAQYTTNLVDSDLALAGERADDEVNRAARDEAVSQVRATLIEFKDLINATYPGNVAGQFGLEGETPTLPDLVLTYATNAINLLKSRSFDSEPKRGRPALDSALLAQVIEEDTQKLKDALSTVSNEEREFQEKLVARNRAEDEWARAYSSISAITAGLFKLAGNDELAERLRPTERKSSGVDSQEQSGSESPAGQ